MTNAEMNDEAQMAGEAAIHFEKQKLFLVNKSFSKKTICQPDKYPKDTCLVRIFDSHFVPSRVA